MARNKAVFPCVFTLFTLANAFIPRNSYAIVNLGPSSVLAKELKRRNAFWFFLVRGAWKKLALRWNYVQQERNKVSFASVAAGNPSKTSNRVLFHAVTKTKGQRFPGLKIPRCSRSFLGQGKHFSNIIHRVRSAVERWPLNVCAGRRGVLTFKPPSIQVCTLTYFMDAAGGHFSYNNTVSLKFY